MRVYKVGLDDQAVTGAITLVQAKAGTASILRILRAWCSQRNITSSGQQSIQILRKTVAATVTSYTPLLTDPGDAASNMVSGVSATGVNATVEGTDGDVLLPDAFNLLNGWLWVPTPEERFIVPPGGIIALKLPNAPASSTTFRAGFLLGEEG